MPRALAALITDSYLNETVQPIRQKAANTMTIAVIFNRFSIICPHKAISVTGKFFLKKSYTNDMA